MYKFCLALCLLLASCSKPVEGYLCIDVVNGSKESFLDGGEKASLATIDLMQCNKLGNVKYYSTNKQFCDLADEVGSKKSTDNLNQVQFDEVIHSLTYRNVFAGNVSRQHFECTPVSAVKK